MRSKIFRLWFGGLIKLMQRGHVVIVLGSGVVVFGLATLSAFFIFSPFSVVESRRIDNRKQESGGVLRNSETNSDSAKHSYSDDVSVLGNLPSSPLEIEDKVLKSPSFEKNHLKYDGGTSNSRSEERLGSSSDFLGKPYHEEKVLLYKTDNAILHENDIEYSFPPKKIVKSYVYPNKYEDKQKKRIKDQKRRKGSSHYSNHSIKNYLKSPYPAYPSEIDSYWIQVGSYSSLGRAKNAQQTLRKSSITSNIEIYDLDSNKSFVYRLKIGAWPSKREASNFLQYFKNSRKGKGSEFLDDAFVTVIR